MKARVFGVALLSLAAVACGRSERPQPPPPYWVQGDVIAFPDPSARSSTIVVEPVHRGGEAGLSLTGRLVWDEDATVRVFPPVSGRVARIATDLGRTVRKGDLLAVLASPDFGQAQSDTARAEADFRTAEHNLARVRLLQERGAAARRDLEQAEADDARARAESERTRTRLRLWGGERAQDARVDEAFPLRSPVGGLVVERNLNPGQEVRSDGTTPLFVVSDPRRLWVLLDVTEKDLAAVAAGARLVVHAQAYPNREFAGSLDRLGAGLDPATRTVHARGTVANAGGLLKSEMYVTVDAETPRPSTHLVVPARAVIDENGRQFVFVEERPGRYRRTPVSLGTEREGAVPVVDGLAADARIVTEGSLLLEAAWAGGGKS
jgi:membrane fusion protein, heavy metal efflux system